MRSAPIDLDVRTVRHALAQEWRVDVTSLEYVPEGGGSHHWSAVHAAGRRHFVTVDDLDDKTWMADDREHAFLGMTRALHTAYALRHDASLDFVVAPMVTEHGELVHRLTERYAVSLFPHIGGRSFPFGRYADRGVRDLVLEMLAAVHAAPLSVAGELRRDGVSYSGHHDLDAFLAEPGRPWTAGDFGEPARAMLLANLPAVQQLVGGFGQLVEATAAARADVVVTHGEPHPANLLATGDDLLLIDWDTAAVAPPERDLSVVVTSDDPHEPFDRYEQVAGRRVRREVVVLYQLRWYLDDLASAVRMFSNAHQRTADTERWWEGLAPRLAQLPRQLDRLRNASP